MVYLSCHPTPELCLRLISLVYVSVRAQVEPRCTLYVIRYTLWAYIPTSDIFTTTLDVGSNDVLHSSGDYKPAFIRRCGDFLSLRILFIKLYGGTQTKKINLSSSETLGIMTSSCSVIKDPDVLQESPVDKSRLLRNKRNRERRE